LICPSGSYDIHNPREVSICDTLFYQTEVICLPEICPHALTTEKRRLMDGGSWAAKVTRNALCLASSEGRLVGEGRTVRVSLVGYAFCLLPTEDDEMLVQASSGLNLCVDWMHWRRNCICMLGTLTCFREVVAGHCSSCREGRVESVRCTSHFHKARYGVTCYRTLIHQEKGQQGLRVTNSCWACWSFAPGRGRRQGTKYGVRLQI
jgi:hypothetical protein